MPDDKDDTFQASMIALHGSTCSANLEYLQVSTPKAGQQFQQLHKWNASRFQCYLPLRSVQCAACCSWLLDWTWCTTIHVSPQAPVAPLPTRPSPRSSRPPSPPTSKIAAPSLTLTITYCHSSAPQGTRTCHLWAGLMSWKHPWSLFTSSRR